MHMQCQWSQDEMNSCLLCDSPAAWARYKPSQSVRGTRTVTQNSYFQTFLPFPLSPFLLCFIDSGCLHFFLPVSLSPTLPVPATTHRSSFFVILYYFYFPLFSVSINLSSFHIFSSFLSAFFLHLFCFPLAFSVSHLPSFYVLSQIASSLSYLCKTASFILIKHFRSSYLNAAGKLIH